MRFSDVARAEVAALDDKWQKAPAHVRGLAGAYVAPIIDAVQALSRAAADMDARLQALEGGRK